MKRAVYPLLLWLAVITIAFVITARAQVNTDGLIEFTLQRIARPSPTPMHVWLPPAQYDHEYRATPSKPFMVLRFSTSEELRRACVPAVWLPGYDIACAFPKWHGGCLIIALEDEQLIARGFNPEHVMRHEIGHCNGWAGDHAGGIDPRIM